MTEFLTALKVQPWPHQSSQAEMDAFYGNPRGPGGKVSPTWSKAFLVDVKPPWKMVFTADNGKVSPIKKFSFNKMAAPSLSRVFDAIWEHYDKDQAAIEARGLHQYGGAFNFRKIRGSSHISNHAYACAIDIDPEHNPLGAKKGRMPEEVVALFTAEGWRWGGNYIGRKDWMHFEAVR
jgi:hypothetical protein